MSKRLITATVGLAFGTLALGILATAPMPARTRDTATQIILIPATTATRADPAAIDARPASSPASATRPSAASDATMPAAAARRGGIGERFAWLPDAGRARTAGRIKSKFGAIQLISTCRPGARIAGSRPLSQAR